MKFLALLRRFLGLKPVKRPPMWAFTRVTWRGTTHAWEKCDYPVGISFDPAKGPPIRLLLSVEMARHVMETLQSAINDYAKCTNSHSASSSGSPQSEGSMPAGGDQV